MRNEMEKCEEVFCFRGSEIMNNLSLKDIKALRLVNKCLYNIVDKYLCEIRSIRLNIRDHNQQLLWNSDRRIKFKISTLSIHWMYGYERFSIIPNQFININKLLLSFDVGCDFETFDIFLSQLPCLKYFGFLFSMHTLNCEWWNTLYSYPNLETLELASSKKYIGYFDQGPLCNFIQRHSNIHTLRISLSLLRAIWKSLIIKNVSFKCLYLHWDEYFQCLSTKAIDTYFTQWFEFNLYHELYFEFASDNERLDKYNSNCQYIPGIKEIRFLKLAGENNNNDDRIPNIEDEQIIAKIISESEWFNFFFK